MYSFGEVWTPMLTEIRCLLSDYLMDTNQGEDGPDNFLGGSGHDSGSDLLRSRKANRDKNRVLPQISFFWSLHPTYVPLVLKYSLVYVCFLVIHLAIVQVHGFYWFVLALQSVRQGDRCLCDGAIKESSAPGVRSNDGARPLLGILGTDPG